MSYDLPSRCSACNVLLCTREALMGQVCDLCALKAEALLAARTGDPAALYAVAKARRVSEQTARRYLKLASEMDLPLPCGGRLPTEWTRGPRGDAAGLHEIWAGAVLSHVAWVPRDTIVRAGQDAATARPGVAA